MEMAIILIFIAAMVAMFWSVNVSKRLSVVVFSVIFFGIAITTIIVQGFTELAFKNIGFFAVALFVGWVRLSKSTADTARAREQLKDRLSQGKYSSCKVCGSKKLTYHRTPKSVSQLLLGGLTCDNCGVEINVPFDIFLPR